MVTKDTAETVEEFSQLIEQSTAKHRDSPQLQANKEVIKQLSVSPLNLANQEERLNELDLKELETIKEEGIVRVNTRSRSNTLRKLSREHHKLTNGEMKFFVSEEIQLQGKVTNRLYDYTIPITLMTESTLYKDDGDIISLSFIGEKVSRKKKGRETNKFIKDFWLYNFKANNQTFTLLIDEKISLDSGEYIIKGSLIKFEDNTDLGNVSRLPSHSRVIVVNTTKARIPKFKTDIEFMKEVKRLKLNNVDKFKEFMLSKGSFHYINPPQYEDMLISVLLSHNKDGYPLHFLGIGQGGCGKSRFIEGLTIRSNEGKQFQGNDCTFKSLVPSYAEVPAKPGHLINSNRFSINDEFFRALMKVKSDDRPFTLTALDSLLEHKDGLKESGKGSIPHGKMTSQFIGVTNPPPYNSETFERLLQTFKESITTFSRILLFWYPAEHYKFVNLQKRNRTQRKITPISSDDFLGFYDYVKSVECEYDHKKFLKVYDTLLGYTKRHTYSTENENLISKMYEMRFDHHLMCLLDGIIKKRCVLTNNETNISFKAIPSDYTELLNMGVYILETWGLTIINEV